MMRFFNKDKKTLERLSALVDAKDAVIESLFKVIETHKEVERVQASTIAYLRAQLSQQVESVEGRQA